MTTHLVQKGNPGNELSTEEIRLAAAAGSVNLAAAARAIEATLPKSERKPMLSETLTEAERKAEFERMKNHAGDNLAQAAMRMKFPK